MGLLTLFMYAPPLAQAACPSPLPTRGNTSSVCARAMHRYAENRLGTPQTMKSESDYGDAYAGFLDDAIRSPLISFHLSPFTHFVR